MPDSDYRPFKREPEDGSLQGVRDQARARQKMKQAVRQRQRAVQASAPKQRVGAPPRHQAMTGTGSTRPRKRPAPRRHRVRIRWNRIILLLLGVLVLLSLIFLPLFYLKTIEVQGVRQLTPAEVLDAAELERDHHLLSYVSGSLWDRLSLRFGRYEDRIREALPEVAEVKIRPGLPSKAVIEIVEREPIAYLDNGDGFVTVDATGRILNHTMAKPPQVPLVQGVIVHRYKPGDEIIEEEKARLQDMIEMMQFMIDQDKEAEDAFSLMTALHVLRMSGDGAVHLYLRVPDRLIGYEGDGAEAQTSQTTVTTEAPDTPAETSPTEEGVDAPAEDRLLLVLIDRASQGEEDLIWLRNLLTQGGLRGHLLAEDGYDDLGGRIYPGILDLQGEQRSFRVGEPWPKGDRP